MQAQGKNQPRADWQPYRPRSCPFWWLSLSCGLCLIPLGCAGPNRTSSGDPLFGGAPPLSNGAKTAPASNQRAATGPVPALPAPNATASNAALASGTVQPVDGRHDLQIGDSRPPPAGPAWAGQPASGNTVLQPPQPAPLLNPTTTRGAAPAFTPAVPARLASYEQAKAQLQSRGVTWFRLETGEQGGFTFSCSIPNRQNRNINHTFEAQAQTELAAIQAVLEQIDKEQ
jgi:hypothetical protein